MNQFPTSSALSRKTKTEIIQEYEKLLGNLDDAKRVAEEVYEPESVKTVTRAEKEYSEQAIVKAVGTAKSMLSARLSELSEVITVSLDTLLKDALAEAAIFSELRSAIDISRKQLKTQHNIEVAADTITQLVERYEKEKRELDQKLAKERAAIEENAERMKRDWKREQEEYAYDTKLRRSRDEALYDDKRKKQEDELKTRERAIGESEQEIARLRAEAGEFAIRIEEASETARQETAREAKKELTEAIEVLKKEWENERALLAIKQKHSDEYVKDLEAELAQLKKDADAANNKAQQLALKIIEARGAAQAALGSKQ